MTSAQDSAFLDLSAIDNSHQFYAIKNFSILLLLWIIGFTINIISALETSVHIHFFPNGVTAGFKFQL